MHNTLFAIVRRLSFARSSHPAGASSPLAGASSALAGAFIALALTSLSACGGNTSLSPGDGGTTTDGTVVAVTPLPCDIAAIVVPNCQSCHSSPPQNSAPMPLVTWEDFHAVAPSDTYTHDAAPGAEVYQAAAIRIHDAQNPMPQAPYSITDAQKATLDAWFAAGAPKTDDGTHCATQTGDGGTATGDSSVTPLDAAAPLIACSGSETAVSLAPASPWAMPQTTEDQYVCYSVNIPATGTNHIVAMSPNIVNHKIVHHVLLFQAPSNDQTVTTTPAPCSAAGSLTWRIVYGWAPGGGAMQTPPDVGFPYDATTKWVVQVHYNNINGLAGETDTSGFSFCSTDQAVKYDADVVAFGTMSFDLPPKSTLEASCSFTVPQLFSGIHAFSAFPHMHQLGQAIQTEQVLADGGLIGMAESIPWSFNTQPWFPIETILNTGDVVRTRCAWMNTTGDDVRFGQDTEDEMCYSFTAYYPKITSGGWSWATPALNSTCDTSTDGGVPPLPDPPGGWSGSAFNDAGAASN